MVKPGYAPTRPLSRKDSQFPMSDFAIPNRRALPLADSHVLGPRLINSHGQDGLGISVYAPEAEAVAICLLSDDGEERVALTGPVHGNWHGFLPGVRAGQRYGFRAWGPWDPAQGLRFNPAKLLLDPYARGIERSEERRVGEGGL